MTVALRDVTLRDGLQDERPVDTPGRLRILDALIAAGVRDLEVASFVRPDRVPAMAGAAEVVSHALRLGDAVGLRVCVLVPNRRGAEHALAAGARHLVFVVSVSEDHNLGNVGRSVDASLTDLAAVVETAGSAGADVEVVLGTAFGCPHRGPVPADDVIARASHALDAGAVAITLADTIGTAVPTEVRELVKRVAAVAGDRPVGVHLHDTRGLGIANALAAIDAGAARIDGAVGGLGGCPFAPGASGNVALEDLVDCLDGMGIPTGIDVDRLVEAAEMACSAVGRVVTSHVGVAGPRHRRLVAR